MLKILLIVTVLGGGGPVDQSNRPIKNAAIRVTHDGKLVGRSQTGSLRLRVRPGVYNTTAALERNCESKRVSARRGTVKVTLYCSIK
jgi:hypothetical protein